MDAALILTIVFGLWLGIAFVADGIVPLLALKEPRRFGPYAVMAGLFSLIPLACLIGMSLTSSLTPGRTWALALSYLIAMVGLEIVVARKRNVRKKIKGKEGLRMSYRVPIGICALIPFALFIADDIVWTLTLTSVVAFIVGLIGRLRLAQAVYVKPDDV